MGKRLENWLSKAGNSHTKACWKSHWLKFATWATTTKNPLNGKPYMECGVEEVDDAIRSDFEAMPSHLFQDKYRDILSKYLVSFGDLKSNTARAKVSAIQSFLTNEAMSIQLQRGKVPKAEMAKNEHRFNLEELRKMWLVADTEGKARLSVAVSLGWSVGDFLNLETSFIREVVKNVDGDGFASFDYQRHKTKARVRGILTPNAIRDLNNYFPRTSKKYLWSSRTKEGINSWIKTLYREASLKENGTVRFHLIRKYVYDVAVSQIGPFEAKLLIGKEIDISDSTYLHGLEDRLLERYKKFGYPFLNLNGQRQEQSEGLKDLEGELDKQRQVLDYLQSENLDLKNRLRRIEESRRESDSVMDRLFEDPEFRALLTKKLKEMGTA